MDCCKVPRGMEVDAVPLFSTQLPFFSVILYTDKKKKRKFSSYVRKIRVEQLQSHTYMTNGLLIYGEIFAHFLIY
jgi:hypothetical protein